MMRSHLYWYSSPFLVTIFLAKETPASLLLEGLMCPLLCPPPPSTDQLPARCSAFELTAFLSLLPFLPQILAQSCWSQSAERSLPRLDHSTATAAALCVQPRLLCVFPDLDHSEPLCFQFLLSDHSFLPSHAYPSSSYDPYSLTL